MAGRCERPIDGVIADARSGCTRSLGRLLDDCRPYLLLIANRELNQDVRGKLGASDLVQETFLDAQRRFEQFTGETEAELLRWLRVLLVNNVRDAARHFCLTGKRDVAREVPLRRVGSGIGNGSLESVQRPSSQLRQLECRSQLQEALDRLPSDQRDVVVLRNLQLLSFGEIGRLMDRSPDAARKLWARAIRALSSELNHDIAE